MLCSGMPEFSYTARPLSGPTVTGKIAAGSRQEAMTQLSSRQLFPLKVELAEGEKATIAAGGRRIRGRTLAVFYSQMADLLQAGVPLLRCLELLERQSVDPALAAVLQDLRQQVADGSRLHDSLRRHRRVFNELVTSMVRAGEEGSFLEEVLKRVAVFTEHQEDLKGRVVGALVYPLFLLGFGTIVVAVMLIKFVPQFEPIFARMREKGELPWATTLLTSMSNALQTWWWLIFGAMAGAGFFVWRWMESERGREVIDQFKLKAPGWKRISRSLAVASFCRVLGTLLKNGVPLLNSLKIAKDATGNVVLRKAIENASQNVTAGKSLAGPLRASGQFPPEIVEMVGVGEEANNLENVLIDIADNLERRAQRDLDLAVRMLEPLLLLVMAAMVLFVVIALLLPILQSSGVVG